MKSCPRRWVKCTHGNGGNMRIRKWIYTALILGGIAAIMPGFLQSQQDGAPGANTPGVSDNDAVLSEDDLPAFIIRSDVSMVSVPVTVRNADGSFYKGLTQKSFRVLEDGKAQEIIFFTQEALSTHVAMVLDVSGSVRPEWGAIKYAVKRFLEQLRPDDYFSITTFNDEIKLKMDWGKKTDRVDDVLTSIYCKDVTNLWDAVWVVSTEAFKGIDGKKVIIIMSDGLDNNSDSTFQEAVYAAVEAGISTYVVSQTKALQQHYEYVYPEIPQWALQRELLQGEIMLQQLARSTGGRVLQPNNFGRLDDIYGEVYEELRNQYTIGYFSTNTAKDGSYREIDVVVSIPESRGITITARPGYYAPRK